MTRIAWLLPLVGALACGGGVSDRRAPHAVGAKPATPTDDTAKKAAAPPVEDPGIPSGWVRQEGFGWSCAFPVTPTLTPFEERPHGRGQGAVAYTPDGDTVFILTTALNPAALKKDQDPKQAPAEFVGGVIEGMSLTVESSTPATLQRDHLTCEGANLVGVTDVGRQALTAFLCEGRTLVFGWAGASSRLAEVVESCHFTEIAYR